MTPAEQRTSMMDLRRQIDDLTARVIAVEEGLVGMVEPLMRLGLTIIEAQMLALLLKRATVTLEALYYVLYGADDTEKPGIKTVEVHLWKLRGKLAKLGVSIVNRRGYGWEISRQGKTVISKHLRRIVGGEPRKRRAA